MLRHEDKYLTNITESTFIEGKIAKVIKVDHNINQTGNYKVTSLYLDTLKDDCFNDNIRGIEPRKKYRIRYYNNDTSLLKLELKEKIHGLTKKRHFVRFQRSSMRI